ncbi:hypothetical protein D9613_003554 [Agrocybe pediades]|uniref:Uncharacterized protein n=1 Tax=Agrocybe pediades TaxID=84607 RepID=A0A8H4QQ81_9AGAR|nr:hypothetical protein D9613_003554 [Agrocybe pediades]
MTTLLDPEGNRQPKPVYHTPTRPAAKILEELVEHGITSRNGRSSSSSGSKTSSSSSKSKLTFTSDRDRTDNTLTPPSTAPPLPLYPPLPKLPPNVQTDNTYSSLGQPVPALHTVVTPPLEDMPDLNSMLFDGRYSKYEHPNPPSQPTYSKHSSSSSSSKGFNTQPSDPLQTNYQIIEELKRERERIKLERSAHRKDSKDSTNSTSPTDSHPHRTKHSRSHSHGRSHHSSSSTSEAISNLLLTTTARLSQETARANQAERHAAELLAMFKKTHEAKSRLERDLMKVQEELGLYKLQLDVAQKEIFRAQEIVDRVERERANAEEEAARARSRMHKLHEELAVERARDEARNAGFEEGLRQGRAMFAASLAGDGIDLDMGPSPEGSIGGERYFTKSGRKETGQKRRRASDVSRYVYPSEDASVISGSSGSSLPQAQPPGRTESRSTNVHPTHQEPPKPSQQRPRASSSATITNRRRESPPTRRRSPDSPPPDVGLYTSLLPRPTITTPVPADVPSTQPQPAPAMPAHQTPTMPHMHESNIHSKPHPSYRNGNTRSHPESIEVQPLQFHELERNLDSNEPIRPTSVWNRSPSMFQERVPLPPDNYIPVMDANSMISLPPPHELSRMVSPTSDIRPTSTVPDGDVRGFAEGGRKRSDSQAMATAKYGRPTSIAPTEGSRKRSESRSHPAPAPIAPTPSSDPPPAYNVNDNNARAAGVMPSRATSNVSRGSTHISQLDILSPPRESIAIPKNNGKGRSYEPSYQAESPTIRYLNNRQRLRDQQQPPTEKIAEEWRQANQEYFRPLSPESNGSRTGVFDRPDSAMSKAASSNERPKPRPPRRPREIVLPAPLGDVFADTKANVVPSPSGGLSVTTPPHASRTTSNTTVPGIEVVTPSTHASSRFSQGTVLDPILLTPDSANRPLPPATNIHNQAGPERINMVLPDNNLPPGFVPLSPIIPSLNSYPAGFAPNIAKDHPGSMSPNFTYSSPLIR